MPVKKDESDKRWVEMEVFLPGTPEQVWQAMATGPGNAAWFAKAEIEPRVGGKFGIDFGDGVSTGGEVTTWEPPERFGYIEREWMEEAPAVATEITIIGREGNRCVMRMVHSLFASTDDWDDQLENFQSGWPAFFDVLRIYLAHFAGSNAASYMINRPATGDGLAAWIRLAEALDLAGANVGERRSTTSGPEQWSGVVEHVYQDANQRWMTLRLDLPSPGVAAVGTFEGPSSTSMIICRFFYGDDAAARAAETEPRWKEWVAEIAG